MSKPRELHGYFYRKTGSLIRADVKPIGMTINETTDEYVTFIEYCAYEAAIERANDMDTRYAIMSEQYEKAVADVATLREALEKTNKFINEAPRDLWDDSYNEHQVAEIYNTNYRLLEQLNKGVK